jgi:conjugative relaxase-like TrwC/TraI family protein
LLRIHVLHRGGHAYYLDDLVPGRAEGTRLSGESPGSWEGQGSADLGLAGTVAGPDFAQLLAGRHPGSGRSLRQERPNGTAGFDLTFCAPKSVSILHLLAPTEMASQVGMGHAVAVADATGYLERAAAGVRRRREGGQIRLDATGLAAGAFLHRTSRALDPHLHTHVVVANVAQGVDGSWSSLDSRRLFRHGPAAQAIYHARLRYELSERLGVAWRLRRSGLSDVVGVDPTLCHLFSGRTADMEEHLYRRRRSRPGLPAASRRISALVTRPPKDRTRTVDELVAGWRARALDLGYPPSELTRVVGLGRSVMPPKGQGFGRATGPEPPPAPSLAVDRGLDPELLARRLHELARDERSLSRLEVVAEVASACPAGARSAFVESVASHLVASALAVAVPVEEQSPSTQGLEPRWQAKRLVDGLVDLPRTGLSNEGSRSAAARQYPSPLGLDDRREPTTAMSWRPGAGGREMPDLVPEAPGIGYGRPKAGNDPLRHGREPTLGHAIGRRGPELGR